MTACPSKLLRSEPAIAAFREWLLLTHRLASFARRGRIRNSYGLQLPRSKWRESSPSITKIVALDSQALGLRALCRKESAISRHARERTLHAAHGMTSIEVTNCLAVFKSCADACDRCSSACLNEDGVETMRRCMLLDRECAAICRLAAVFIARNARGSRELCRLCGMVCDACAVECQKHSAEHCQKCAQACRRCAEACRRMSAAA
jgi:hypothetical protein